MKRASAIALAAAGLLLGGCTPDGDGQPEATASPTEPSPSELAREWLETAAAGDESRLRQLTYRSEGSGSSEIRGVVGLMEELGELRSIEIGRPLGPDASGGTRSAIVCTRLNAADGRQVDGGVRLREQEGSWLPWEWLQFVVCQDDKGGYGAP